MIDPLEFAELYSSGEDPVSICDQLGVAMEELDRTRKRLGFPPFKRKYIPKNVTKVSKNQEEKQAYKPESTTSKYIPKNIPKVYNKEKAAGLVLELRKKGNSPREIQIALMDFDIYIGQSTISQWIKEYESSKQKQEPVDYSGYDDGIVELARKLYERNKSLAKTQAALEDCNVYVSSDTISNWINAKEPEPTFVKCTNCQSHNIKRDGIRKNKNHINQRYECHDCGGRFSERGRRKPDEANVKKAIEIYNSGYSLRKTQASLAMSGINVTHKTIANWINGKKMRYLR